LSIFYYDMTNLQVITSIKEKKISFFIYNCYMTNVKVVSFFKNENKCLLKLFFWRGLSVIHPSNPIIIFWCSHSTLSYSIPFFIPPHSHSLSLSLYVSPSPHFSFPFFQGNSLAFRSTVQDLYEIPYPQNGVDAVTRHFGMSEISVNYDRTYESTVDLGKVRSIFRLYST
jgi:hypothetical protein